MERRIYQRFNKGFSENLEEKSEKVFYTDFLPRVVPSRSSCCTKGFNTFSEIVEEVNNWLRSKEKIEVINCEVIPANPFDTESLIIRDSWPNTLCVRGLRLWWKNSTLEGIEKEALAKRRFLLGFRDFLPNVNKKGIFRGHFEPVKDIVMRVNTYIATKAAPVKVLSLQTLDVPFEGYVDIDLDTDENVAIPQHGHTRFARILRLFFLSQYPRLPRMQSAAIPLPQFDIKDFTNKPGDKEGVVSMMSRAMAWCSNENYVGFLNVQVLDARGGSLDTSFSTWTLESPGHVPNKFSSFVRVVYMSSFIRPARVTSFRMDSSFIRQKILEESKENDIEVLNLNEGKRRESAVSRSSRQFVVTPCDEEEDDPIKDIVNGVIHDAVIENNRSGSATSRASKIIAVKPSTEASSANNRKQSSVSRTSSKLITVKSSNNDIISNNEENMDVINIDEKYNNEKNAEKKDESTEVQNVGSKHLTSEDSVNKGDAETLSIIPDYDEITNRNLVSKSFQPLLITEGGLWSEGEYESIDLVLNKLNSWISAIKGIPVQIHTHYQYFRGDYPDLTKSQWVRYLPGGSWLPIYHVIVETRNL